MSVVMVRLASTTEAPAEPDLQPVVQGRPLGFSAESRACRSAQRCDVQRRLHVGSFRRQQVKGGGEGIWDMGSSGDGYQPAAG